MPSRSDGRKAGIAVTGKTVLALASPLRHARAVFAVAIAEKPAGRFMILSRTRIVKRHPEGDW
jgi:hypothetical protein